MKIELRDISFSYRSRQGSRRVFKDLSFRINHGEAIGILGGEGSGKSTLLQIIAGLQEPDTGSVLIDEVDAWRSKKEWRNIRHKIGYLFQFPEQQFFNENVEKELKYELNILGMRESEQARMCDEALALAGLPPNQYLHLSTFALSIGEARRVAIAASMITKRELLLLDEPTAGLDAIGISSVVDMVRQARTQGCTIVLISHDVDVLASCVSRIAILSEGMIAFDGSSERVLRDEHLLADHGYTIPQVEQCRRVLQERGVDVENRIYSEKELHQIVARMPVHRSS